MQATRTFYGYEVTTRIANRKTVTRIDHPGYRTLCIVTTRGDRHKVQHRRMVAFAEYAETRRDGFDVDPMVLHEIAMGRGAFA